MSQVRLSVIVPGYNNPEWRWRRCLESVLATISLDDEIICVDDGSDAGQSITNTKGLNELLSDERVHIVKLAKNGGLSEARNIGVEHARGQYVTFVDSDDEVLPAVYDQVIFKMKSSQSDVGMFGADVVWEDDGLRKIDRLQDGALSAGCALAPKDVLLLSEKCLFNYVWNKVYSKELALKFGIRFKRKGMPYEDTIYNLEWVMAGARWCSVAAVGYVYYHTRTSSLARYKPTMLEGRRIVAAAWQRYKDVVPGARDVLGPFGELNEQALLRAEWKNIWLVGSPYSLFARWRWLWAHGELGGLLGFLKMALFMFARRYFYFRPIRRWNTRRHYPYASDWPG